MRWLKLAPAVLEFFALVLLFTGLVAANTQLKPFEELNQDRSEDMKLHHLWQALKKPNATERIAYIEKNNENFYKLGEPTKVEYFENIASDIAFTSMIAALLFLASKFVAIFTHLLAGYREHAKTIKKTLSVEPSGDIDN